MRMIRQFLATLLCAGSVMTSGLAMAQGANGLSALAHLKDPGVTVNAGWRDLDLQISMTRPVPWRIFTLDAPRRLVIDFSELDWTGLDRETVLYDSTKLSDLRAGLYRPGWSRLVLDLAEPMAVTSSEMKTSDEGAALKLRLSPVSDEVFSSKAGVPETHFKEPSSLLDPGKHRQRGEGPLRVVLDPGHGGIDPGAERDGVVEAELILTFARELRDVLRRAGGFEVVLTRDDNRFVSLEERVTIAREAGADVLLSLHADALAHGRATGATVYTLSKEASDLASEKLAERHDRADLLAGVDLSEQDDEVALVLMGLARTETAPRSDALADALVEGIHSATGSIYKSPRMQAGFSVLKAPDIPSVLIELGFMSSPKDLKRMTSPKWRAQAAEGIRDALQYWALEDATMVDRLRK
ncbi:N-acetylmuramoyl-L-alanine amidase [Aliiroseovarius sp. KMU-50]|uniref:N-acetylmuramoyl-L-alanine amidase n=1 Tax=Aliiroseovarius salicola TaxID=3009082 RepID=A0ABT4W3T4_9RHOB|nr:N-acetylmuramoyl-L-alanine amidase [Aliiroseovarius sp. KMU-50]MDA5094457.1 N-acetylmuramoyl-L-alanine amidase [Aliiroseovarius sp. KMU-50]